MKEKVFDPRRLDLTAFARAAGELEGSVPQAALTRLADSLESTADAPPVRWKAAGTLLPVRGGEPELWLSLQALTRVTLQCQRCLQPVEQALEPERRFRFVRDEALAQQLDEDSEDDVLVLPPVLDLQELLEDELILALPIVPRHDVCPEPLPMSAADPEAEAEEDAEPHPFAALAALKGRKPPQ